MRKDGVPPLARRLTKTVPFDAPIEVWMNPGEDEIEMIILGDPNEDDESHNCDEMGCGQNHVMLRFSLPRSMWPPRPSEIERMKEYGS